MRKRPMKTSAALRRSSQERARETLKRVADALIELDDEQRKVPRVERCYSDKSILERVNRNAASGKRMYHATLMRHLEVRMLINRYRHPEKVITIASELRIGEFANWKPPRGQSDSAIAARRSSYLELSIHELARQIVCLEELKHHCETRRVVFETILAGGPDWPANCPYPNVPFRPSDDDLRPACDRWQAYINKRCKVDLVTMLLALEEKLGEDYDHLLAYDLLYEEHQDDPGKC